MHEVSQSEGLRKLMNRDPVRVIAVTSGKGGVGKTNVAANMAVSLSELGKNVMVLDADLGLANIDVLFGLQPRFNLAHVLSGEVDLNSTVINGPKNVRIVPSASGNVSMIDVPPAAQAAIIQAFAELVDQPDVLVVDTATGLSDNVMRFVTAAHQAVVVVCDEPASLTDAYALIKVLSTSYGVSHFEIVTNQSRRPDEGQRLFEKLRRVADQYLDVVLRHLGDIPHDEWLRRAVQEQRAVVDAYPRSAAGKAFADIAKAIGKPSTRRQVNGSIQFFLERLLGSNAHEATETA
jgi:flagellar biosynthesis protein FlhG